MPGPHGTDVRAASRPRPSPATQMRPFAAAMSRARAGSPNTDAGNTGPGCTTGAPGFVRSTRTRPPVPIATYANVPSTAIANAVPVPSAALATGATVVRPKTRSGAAV